MSRLVPPAVIIFDEASQIEIGDYFPLLLRYQAVLKKLVFIGDHKQRTSRRIPDFSLYQTELSERSCPTWHQRHQDFEQRFRNVPPLG